MNNLFYTPNVFDLLEPFFRVIYELCQNIYYFFTEPLGEQIVNNILYQIVTGLDVLGLTDKVILSLFPGSILNMLPVIIIAAMVFYIVKAFTL